MILCAQIYVSKIITQQIGMSIKIVESSIKMRCDTVAQSIFIEFLTICNRKNTVYLFLTVIFRLCVVHLGPII